VSVERSQIKQALTSKGFVEKSGGDHDKYIYYNQEGKKTQIITLLSRGSSYKVYSDSLLGRMVHQLKINKAQLNNLIECPLTREGYEGLLKSKGII
jgi:hypothetical protein